jgi:hypothetical protein
MNEKHEKFLELAKYKEMLKESERKVREELEALMLELGYGTYIQDGQTDVVYKIVKPAGRFVHFSDVGYVRTAFADERAGTLSRKEAEANGFTVKKS